MPTKSGDMYRLATRPSGLPPLHRFSPDLTLFAMVRGRGTEKRTGQNLLP